MNKSQLLDNILLHIRSIKEDEEKLLMVYEFLTDAFPVAEESGEEYNWQSRIDEKYHKLIKDVAESLTTSQNAVVNMENLRYFELISADKFEPEFFIEDGNEEQNEDEDNDKDDPENDEDFFEKTYYKMYYGELEKIEGTKENTITIEPPDSHTTFPFMEDFVTTLPASRTRADLERALFNRKPFRNFNGIIHNCEFREEWFAFKQKGFENYVTDFFNQYLRETDDDEEDATGNL